jgi:D-arabinose 1-dehydrogenase-like Zn-dependent alcohol dehydrogenase
MTMRIFIGFAQVPEKETSVLVVLNPAESKRVLAKATVALPVVQNAWKNGMIIIARGITSAFVTGEFFGTSVEPKAVQTVGSEGSVQLSLEGEAERVEKAFDLVKSVKVEPPVRLPETFFVSSAADYNYDASAQLAMLKGV